MVLTAEIGSDYGRNSNTVWPDYDQFQSDCGRNCARVRPESDRHSRCRCCTFDEEAMSIVHTHEVCKNEHYIYIMPRSGWKLVAVRPKTDRGPTKNRPQSDRKSAEVRPKTNCGLARNRLQSDWKSVAVRLETGRDPVGNQSRFDQKPAAV